MPLQHLLRPARDTLQVFCGKALEQVGAPGFVPGLHLLRHTHPVGLVRAERLFQRVVEVAVGRLAQRQERRLGRLERAQVAQRNDRFEAHARVLVDHAFREQAQRMRDVAPHVAQHARRSGACPWLVAGEQLLEQLAVEHVVLLLHPQRLEQVVHVRLARFLQPARPRARQRDHIVRVPPRQLDARPVAHAVLRRLQQLEQLLDRSPRDRHRFERRPGRAGGAACAR